MVDFAFSLSLLPHREITFKDLGKTEFLKETIQTIEAWGFKTSGGWLGFIRNLEDGTLKDVVLTSQTGMIRLQAEETDSELEVRYTYHWWRFERKLAEFVLILLTTIASIMTIILAVNGLIIILDYGAQVFLLCCFVASVCWIPTWYGVYLSYRMFKKIDSFILEKARSLGGEKIASSWRSKISYR